MPFLQPLEKMDSLVHLATKDHQGPQGRQESQALKANRDKEYSKRKVGKAPKDHLDHRVHLAIKDGKAEMAYSVPMVTQAR